MSRKWPVMELPGLRLLARFRRGRSGVAAIEYAMLAPFMIALYFGSLELSELLLADRKTTTLSSTVADLVAQDDTITDGEIQDIFNAAAAVLQPFNAGEVGIAVFSVRADAGGNLSIGWCDRFRRTDFTPNTGVVPANLVAPGGSVIIADVTYRHRSITGVFLTGEGFVVGDRFFLRPRRTTEVERQPAGGGCRNWS